MYSSGLCHGPASLSFTLEVIHVYTIHVLCLIRCTFHQYGNIRVQSFGDKSLNNQSTVVYWNVCLL